MIIIRYYTSLILAVIVLFFSPLPSSWSTEHNTVHPPIGRKKSPVGCYVPYKSSFCWMEKRWEQLEADGNIMPQLYHLYLNDVHVIIPVTSLHFTFPSFHCLKQWLWKLLFIAQRGLGERRKEGVSRSLASCTHLAPCLNRWGGSTLTTVKMKCLRSPADKSLLQTCSYNPKENNGGNSGAYVPLGLSYKSLLRKCLTYL